MKPTSLRAWPTTRILKYAALFCLSSLACAQDSPATDPQLRSAYCVTVVQEQIQQLRKIMTVVMEDPAEGMRKQAEEMSRLYRERLAQLQNVLTRLQASIRPGSDPGPLANAQTRGAKDLDEYLSMPALCATRCYAAGPSIDRCESDCQDSALIKRIEACSAPTWLPE